MSTLPLSSNPSDPLRLSSQPAASPPSPPFFDPAPEIAAAILHDLADPFQSLHSIAKARATTLEGLTLWMQRPEIARRLDALESAFTRRSRLQAGSYLPLCIDAIARAIAGATRDEVQIAQSSTAQSQVSQSQSPQSPQFQTNPKLDEHHRKARETLLRMTRVMMQLSKFQNAPPPKAEKASPARPSAVNAADSRTPNSPMLSRVAAIPSPQQVSHPDRRGEPTTPRAGQSAQPHADSSSIREHQPTQRELSAV